MKWTGTEACKTVISADPDKARALVRTRGRSRRTTRPSLRQRISTREAFQTIARAALSQIAANATVLSRGQDAEAVHQVRVAARRLRCALSMFRPMVDDDGLAHVKGELRWLAQAMNDARDLDVFLSETAEPARTQSDATLDLDTLIAEVKSARVAAHARVQARLTSDRYRSLLREVDAWVERGDWLSDDRPGAQRQRRRSARDFGVEALDKRWRKLIKRGRSLKKQTTAERHQVRMEAKKLRYAAEAFAPFFPGRHVTRFIARAKALQDDLGALNDIATARSVVGKLRMASGPAFTAGRLVGARTADAAQAISQAVSVLKRLKRAGPFWRAHPVFSGRLRQAAQPQPVAQHLQATSHARTPATAPSSSSTNTAKAQNPSPHPCPAPR